MTPPQRRGELPALEDAAGRLPSRQPRRSRRLRLGIAAVLAVAAVVAIGGYAAWLAQPKGSGSSSGPTVAITFGNPTGGLISCGSGASMNVSRVTWLASTEPLTTAQFGLEVQELGDGDVIGEDNGPKGVTASDACIGTAFSYAYDWYAVLESPTGANEATFTYVDHWQDVPPVTGPVPVAAGSTLVVISATAFAGVGYALEVTPVGGGPAVSGFTAL